MRRTIFLVVCPLMIASCGGSNSVTPSFSLSPGEPSPIVRGVYTLQSSDCNTDGSDLSIAQDSNRLWFKGGFDYGQVASMGGYEYSGYVDSGNTVHFTIVGVEDTATCTASLLETVLQGTCELSSGTCDFALTQGQDTASPDTTTQPTDSVSSDPQCGQPGVFCPRPADPPPPGSCVDEFGYSTCAGGSAPR